MVADALQAQLAEREVTAAALQAQLGASYAQLDATAAALDDANAQLDGHAASLAADLDSALTLVAGGKAAARSRPGSPRGRPRYAPGAPCI